MVGDATPANRVPGGPGVDEPSAATPEAVAGATGVPARSIARRLTVGVFNACLRYRVTGLAAEAAFFALLSLPPLVLGLIASLSYFAEVVGDQTVDRVTEAILDLTSTVLTPDAIADMVIPTLEGSLQDGRGGIISIGFVLALWSGSRALNVFIDTITIMYGLGGHRGIIKTRALSFSLYVVGLVLGIVAVPLLLAGPTLVGRILPESLTFLTVVYWPLVILLSVAFLTTLYHLSVPVRTSWASDLPGAAVALLIWILGGVALRETLNFALGGSSLYGPLTAPIALLLWLFVTALAVLVGAALNAEVDKLHPRPSRRRDRRHLARERATVAAENSSDVARADD